VGDGAVWVLSWVAREGAVLRTDSSTNEIAATIPVGDQLSNIAIGEGAVWVTRSTDGDPPSGEVVRIDPTTNEIVDRIPVSGGWPRDLVIGEGSVWAYGHSRLAEHGWEASSLWRIDPFTNEAVVVLDQDGFLGDGSALPDNVAVGDGHVWAAAADERGTGLRIDPATGEVGRFEVEGGFAWPFLVESGRVWFGRDEIRLLDTETLEVVDVVDAEIESIDAAFDPSTASLWVANYDGTITRIDLG
jgi:DNA-binding beta-propeller fold protein YncE